MNRRRSSVVVGGAICVCWLLLAAATSCGGDAPSASGGDDPVVPIATFPVPGACDVVQEHIDEPVIVVNGERVPATLGVASWECGTLTGAGFVTYVYNPVLIDADGPVEVLVDDDLAIQIDWALGEPFTERDDGQWVSREPDRGCSRVVIGLASPTGRSTATYGADVRVGGSSVECPQRELDPSDPDITEPFETVDLTSTTVTTDSSAG